jgi:hypothetical protein
MKTWPFAVAATVFLGERSSSGQPTHQRRYHDFVAHPGADVAPTGTVPISPPAGASVRRGRSGTSARD